MVFFLIVGLVMVIGIILAIEWLMDWLARYNDDDYLVSGIHKPLSPAERRAAAQADFDDACDDLRWTQRAAAQRWLVSSHFAKQAFKRMSPTHHL
jgi:hypothetical protein